MGCVHFGVGSRLLSCNYRAGPGRPVGWDDSRQHRAWLVRARHIWAGPVLV
jgi:hypothetical protein